jgi:hypothetical protein
MKLIISGLMIFCASQTLADTYVKGYFKKDGTYVQPHFKTDADNTKLNNYSTQGNVNPYTGKKGTVNPWKQNNWQLSNDD